MTSEAIRYIWCQGCDQTTVRELNAAPCPHCHRCAFCGQKLGLHETQCTCDSINDPEKVGDLIREYGITEEQLPRERHRAKIRQELQTLRGIACGLAVGLMIAANAIVGELAEPRSLNKLIALLVIDAITLMMVFKGSSRLFRSIEERRLDREFLQDS